MTHYDELKYRYDGISYIIYTDSIEADLAKYNPEKRTTTYLNGLTDLRSDLFDQYEADVLKLIREVLINKKDVTE